MLTNNIKTLLFILITNKISNNNSSLYIILKVIPYYIVYIYLLSFIDILSSNHV